MTWTKGIVDTDMIKRGQKGLHSEAMPPYFGSRHNKFTRQGGFCGWGTDPHTKDVPTSPMMRLGTFTTPQRKKKLFAVVSLYHNIYSERQK